MNIAVWGLLVLWLPLIWAKAHNIHNELKEIRDILREGNHNG